MKPPTVDDFAYMVESFASPVGYIDVFRETQAVGGFDRLHDRAEEVEVAGLRILIAGLEDIIASKQAADRPKDRAQLPLLYALREERSGQSDG
jgi:predicted nucleotidyltransferase